MICWMEREIVDSKRINVRVRLVIIQEEKILLSYVKDEDFYFYIGGKMEWGETVEEACSREMREECDARFTFRKILYVRDFIAREINEHSVELFILGELDKGEEVEGKIDEEFGPNKWQTWVELDNLKNIDVRPRELTDILLKDFQQGFKRGGVYVGDIE